jgi:hypothetical protein
MKIPAAVKNYFRNKLGRAYPAGLIVTNSSGAEIEGPIEVMFAGMLGALAGFVLGMLVGVVTRILTMNALRGSRGGMHWAAYGAGAGAMALALVELLD